MLHLTSETQILLAVKPVDFRKQIDGLTALCEQRLEQNPSSGTLFVFMNRSRTMVRILCYDTNGYWLATKRLSRGRYKKWPSYPGVTHPVVSWELKKILNKFIVLREKSV